MYDYATLYPEILDKLFPDPTVRRQVEATLDQYGSEEAHLEVRRVRLAVLKLAGRDLEAIKRNVDYACIDYRDVLAWAKYPNAMRVPSWRLPEDSPEKKQITTADRRQYQDWLDMVLQQGADNDGPG